MENTYTIYMHKNKINNKVYIGQTKQTLNRRFRNGDGYKHCPYFYNAIQKYGWDNFITIILKENLNAEEANYWEKYYIKQYDSTNKEKGYNISLGGNTASPEQIERIKESNKKLWEDGFFASIINNPVYCVELDINFPSALEAERQTGIDNSAIQKTCKGKNRYAGIYHGISLHWIFQKDKTEEKIKELKNRQEIIRNIPVYCIELNIMFNDSEQAGKTLHICSSSIRNAVKGKAKSAGKHPKTKTPLHWQQHPELINTTILP